MMMLLGSSKLLLLQKIHRYIIFLSSDIFEAQKYSPQFRSVITLITTIVGNFYEMGTCYVRQDDRHDKRRDAVVIYERHFFIIQATDAVGHFLHKWSKR